MFTSKKSKAGLACGAFLAGVFAGGAGAFHLAARFNEKAEGTLRGTVSSVYDGDSFRLSVPGQSKTVPVRLWGIDAPEKKQLCRQNRKDVACGALAQGALESMIRGQALVCEEKGRSYDRTVALCKKGDQDIGAQMVDLGMAWSETEYARDYYGDAEAEARDKKRGIWSMQADTPEHWRACNLPSRSRSRPADCPPLK